MEGWKEFCSKVEFGKCDTESLRKLAKENSGKFGVYPGSINLTDGSCFFISLFNNSKVLIILGDKGVHYDRFSGVEVKLDAAKARICELNNANCKVLREIFPFTNPVSHKGRKVTIGLGDRLGLASAGHIRLVKEYDVFPVLAQQSIRELNLTGRTYDDVLSAAVWAVFQEGYTSGYGADGDHLKTASEVRMALDCGFTMITLDCSEHINNKVVSLSDTEVDEMYSNLPKDEKERLETSYLGKIFSISDDFTIEFSENVFRRTVLIYYKAIIHTIDIYNNVIKNCGRNIDFEMSIDETLTSTSPESHFFTVSELIAGGVDTTSLAPRFCGEFQKGIDYRGDVGTFTKEFTMHVKIAEYFGYKISVHSGSDKFTVFPIIGEKTGGTYHLKTAGTNWLEAVRIITVKKPELYRRMHKFALSRLDEARKYYHISANAANIPDIDTLSDEQLLDLMNKDDSRQVLHITYGILLLEKNSDGSFMFKDEIYAVLNKYEDEFCQALQKHIGKHLEKLGVCRT